MTVTTCASVRQTSPAFSGLNQDDLEAIGQVHEFESLLRAASPQAPVVERNCMRKCDRCCLCSVSLSVVTTDELRGNANEGLICVTVRKER